MGGDLTVLGGTTALSAGHLASVFGGIGVEPDHGVALALPALEAIGRDLRSGSATLSGIDLPHLRRLDGSLELGPAVHCGSLSFCRTDLGDTCPLTALTAVSLPAVDRRRGSARRRFAFTMGQVKVPLLRPKVGFVLSGGGSRGAYEAGIIHYLRTDLARRLGRHVPIDIVSGTSVGAINAAFLAATMADPDAQAAQLIAAWRALRIEELISLRPMDVLRALRLVLGGEPPAPAPGSFRYGGLLETSGLERFVIRVIPWRGIERSLRDRHLHALSVSSTHVGTGHTVVFLSSAEPVPREWSRDPFVRHRAARIGPRHVLASAAIPMLFPAVKIGDEYYTDGGLRQNTPMSPAIRLGADRLLLVSLRHVASEPVGVSSELERERAEAYPKPLFLAGKALNALLLDHTEYDLARMQRINLILEAGAASFGDKFEDMMNHALIRLRGAPLRRIQAVHIRPSEDIGALAAEFVRSGRMQVRGGFARRLIQRLAAGEARHESDLLSYLLFDGNFASQLIELGRNDAANKADELAELFDVPSAAAQAG